MSEPTPPETYIPAGPNDKDWASERTARLAKLMAVVVLPGLFVVILLGAIVYAVMHPEKLTGNAPKPAIAAVAADPRDQQIAQLQSQLALLRSQATAPTVPGATSLPVTPQPQSLYAGDPMALAQLSARLERVENNQRLLARAAASAYAARALQLASKSASPFLSELAVAEPNIDDSAVVAQLRPYAEKGVPTEVSLAVEFPKAAAAANIAAKADDKDDSFLGSLKHMLGTLVSVRHTDNALGQGTESVLQRAETQMNLGDLKGAVAQLSTLSPATQKAIKPWLDNARARVLVDETTRRLSEIALNRLSQMNATPNGEAAL